MTERPAIDQPHDFAARAAAPTAQPVRTNVLAIVSFIAAFFVPVAAIVTGHLAISQIRRTGEEGRGLAKAGVILGYIFTAVMVVFFIVWLSLFLRILDSAPLP
jgi:peptidyl-prolyl cis-trans isomerase B (cyclophilin B)